MATPAIAVATLTGSTSNPRRSGCPKKATKQTKQQIIWNAVKECCVPFSEIRNQVEPKVSDGMVWKVLAEAGYHWRGAGISLKAMSSRMASTTW